MRVLWVSHFLLFPKTGFGTLQRSRNLFEKIASKNEVSLVCLVSKSEYQDCELIEQARQDLLQYCKTVIFMERRRKTTAFLISIFCNRPYSTEIYFSRKLIGEVKKQISSFDPDVVHVDTMGMLEGFVKKTKLQKKIPFVVSHHNFESYMMRDRASKSKNLIFKLFLKYEAFKLEKYEKKYCEVYSKNIVVSLDESIEFKKLLPNLDFPVVENPVDTEYFFQKNSEVNVQNNNSTNSQTLKKIIFVGNLNWYPNADAIKYFCESILPILIKKYPEIEFIVVGKDREENSLAKRYQNKTTKFLGYVDDVRPYIQGAQVYVCPIQMGGGTRLKLVDAFSSGIPVVSTSFAAQGLYVSENEHLLLADTPEEFASSVVRIFEDKQLANSLSLSARKLVEERFSSKVLATKLEDIYKSVLSS